MKHFALTTLAIFFLFFSFAWQEANTSDPVATALLQKVSDKYAQQKNISADFKLIIQRPKMKPEESDKKYTDTLRGNVLLQGAKFNLSIKEQQIISDGQNIWTYMPGDKEVQVNYFEETDDVFSPSKIFSLHREGFLSQVKEKKTVGGKNLTVIEMTPSKKKTSYFKIDVGIDEATLQIVESKIYQKNGSRYIYKLTKQTFNVPTNETTFNFDPKRYPGVKVVDLR